MLTCDLFLLLQKKLIKWYENSVRFENLMGNGVQKGQNSEILSHSMRYAMYVCCLLN